MFGQVMARIVGRFRRVEPRAAARAYLLGLLSGVERKNCRQLAAVVRIPAELVRPRFAELAAARRGQSPAGAR